MIPKTESFYSLATASFNSSLLFRSTTLNLIWSFTVNARFTGYMKGDDDIDFNEPLKKLLRIQTDGLYSN